MQRPLGCPARPRPGRRRGLPPRPAQSPVRALTGPWPGAGAGARARGGAERAGGAAAAEGRLPRRRCHVPGGARDKRTAAREAARRSRRSRPCRPRLVLFLGHVSCSFSATSPAPCRLPCGYGAFCTLAATRPPAAARRGPSAATPFVSNRDSQGALSGSRSRRGPLAGGPSRVWAGRRIRGASRETAALQPRLCRLAWPTPVQYASESSSESAPPDAGPHRRPIESAPPPRPATGSPACAYGWPAAP